MTSLRATAYRRVVKTLRDLGAAKLWPAEQACNRGPSTRWTPLRALQLLDDIWACGRAALGVPRAA